MVLVFWAWYGWGMTRLHEQYATLLRRGMPEHPDLRVDDTRGPDFVFAVRKAKANGWATVDAKSVARDLITAHALRWYRGDRNAHCKANGAPIEIDAVILDISMGGDGTTCMGEMDYEGYRTHYEQPAILEAILAATEHMEPK